MDTIEEQLKENTGKALCDSGGAYGRNYERNQSRDFKNEPTGKLKFRLREVKEGDGDWEFDECSLSTYHFLSERLCFDADAQQNFEAFAKDFPDDSWFEIVEKYASEVIKNEASDNRYAKRDPEPMTVNTYNHDSLLDQVIQYTVAGDPCDDDALILLMVHGGCDVRGGYSAPKCYRHNGTGATVYDDARATLICQGVPCPNGDSHLEGIETNCGATHNWYTDDAYHWYDDGACGQGFTNLEKYSATNDLEQKGKGVIVIDEDGNGYCPKCGGKFELVS